MGAKNFGWVFVEGSLTCGTPMNFSLDPYNILAGFIFGTLGWGVLSYGRKLDLWQPKAIGLSLMIYPYFFTNNWLLWGIGVALLVVLWFHHDQ